MSYLTRQQLIDAAIDADNLGLFMNSEGDTVDLRNAQTAPTLKKIRDDIYTSAGYAIPVVFTTGLSITTPNQTVEYQDVVYAPYPSELPFTTTGSFVGAQWYVVQTTALLGTIFVRPAADDLPDVNASDGDSFLTQGSLIANDGGGLTYVYDVLSTKVPDNQFVIDGPSGNGRFISVKRDIFDLEYLGLAENASITAILNNVALNFSNSAFSIQLPRTLKNLTCGLVTFPANLNLFEVLAGRSTITQANTNGQTIWSLVNPQNVNIESGVKLVGHVNSNNFTSEQEGLIRINSTTKIGTGGIIRCEADIRNTTSVGLSIFGVSNQDNAFERFTLRGRYLDSGIWADSYVMFLDSNVSTNLRDDSYETHVLNKYSRSVNIFKVIPGEKKEKGITISRQELQSMCVEGETVVLPPGSKTFMPIAQDTIRLPSGCTLTTDVNNPATLVCTPGQQIDDGIVVPGGKSILLIQGKDITVENFIIDFNHGPVWNQFMNPIAFTMPGFIGEYLGFGAIPPDDPIANILIRNNTFINTTTGRRVAGQSNNGDNWAISFASNNGETVKNINIIGNKLLCEDMQLTANGTVTGGYDGVFISHNYIYKPNANAIALSTLQEQPFDNIVVSDNNIIGSTGIGIFLGNDALAGPAPSGVKNVKIMRNYIQVGRRNDSYDASYSTPQFGHCVAIRSFGSSGHWDIRDNVFNSLNKYPLQTIRGINFSGVVGNTPNTFSTGNNVRIGSFSDNLQSGGSTPFFFRTQPPYSDE